MSKQTQANELINSIAEKLNIKLSDEVSRVALSLLKDLKIKSQNIKEPTKGQEAPPVDTKSSRSPKPESIGNSALVNILTTQTGFLSNINTILTKAFDVNAPLRDGVKSKLPTSIENGFNNLTNKIKELKADKPASTVTGTAAKPPAAASTNAAVAPEPIDYIEDVKTVTPVSLESINEKIFEKLEGTLLNVFSKSFKGAAFAGQQQNGEQQPGSGSGAAATGILSTVGTLVATQFGKIKGWFKGAPSGGAAGPTATGPTAAGVKPLGKIDKLKGALKGAGGVTGILGGVAGATLASEATGKILGKDENLQKFDPEDLQDAAMTAKQTGNTQLTQDIKDQVVDQKRNVKIEATQVVAKRVGYTAGSLAASATAKLVWKVFCKYVEKKAPEIFAKIAVRLAAAAGMAAIPVIGWVGTAVSIGMSLYTAYELYSLWKEFQALSDAERIAYSEEASKPLPDNQLPNVEPKNPEPNPTPTPDQKPAQDTTPKTDQKPAQDTTPKTDQKPAQDTTPKTDQKPINVDNGLPATPNLGNKNPEIESINKRIETINNLKLPSAKGRVYPNPDIEKEIQGLKTEELTDTQVLQLLELKTSLIKQKTLLNKVNKQEKLPELAEGGVVNKPTKALIGEAGPEAVIPLEKLSSFTSPNNSFSKAESILEKIANNTATSNQSLGNLIAGFNHLAAALEKTTGVKIPTVINSVTENQSSKDSQSSSQYAQAGNSMISNFRLDNLQGAPQAA